MLDLLGDIGGLSDALFFFATIILTLLSLITKEGPHNYMIKKLFTTRGKKISN